MGPPNKEYKELIYDLKKQEAILRGTCGNDSIAISLKLESSRKIEIIKGKILKMKNDPSRKNQKWNFFFSKRKKNLVPST